MCLSPPDPMRALCSLIAAAVTGPLAGDLWLLVWFLIGAKWCGPLCLNEEVLPAVTLETICLHYVVFDRSDMEARAQSFTLCRHRASLSSAIAPSFSSQWLEHLCPMQHRSAAFKGAKYRAETARTCPALINHTPAANANICTNSSHYLLIICRCLAYPWRQTWSKNVSGSGFLLCATG